MFSTPIAASPSPSMIRGRFDVGVAPPMASQIRYAREEEIFGQGEPAEYIYKVLVGAVRTYRVLRNGRRQIDEFHFVGGHFGIEAGIEHRISAEAICDLTVLAAQPFSCRNLSMQPANASLQLLRLTMESLQRRQDHFLMLGHHKACERVACLLIDLADRAGNPTTLDLQLSRQDMADYLGLTIETVSRTLTQLQLDKIIQMPTSRRIILCDRAALTEMSQ